jgi:hypothetical protein
MASRLLRGRLDLEAELARDLTAELRRLDGRFARLTRRPTTLVGADPLFLIGADIAQR